jgi:SAM-dependent methyltransferase
MSSMADFATFDKRGYPTLDVRSGYREWSATYEETVPRALDLELLEALAEPRWASFGEVADLGCGTGRTASWLRSRGVELIDGVDLTPEMLDRARSRGLYRRLVEADVAATGLQGGVYDLVVTSLVDDHLADVGPLYAEAARLARPAGSYVLAGFHPQFIMASGMPTHFDGPDGEPVAIETYVHPLSEHVSAALDAGWELREMRERLVDDALLALKPGWEPLLGQPVAFAFVWRKR